MPSPPPIRPKSPGWREFASRYHCPAWPGQPPKRSRQFHRHIARHPQSRRGLLSHEQSMRDGPALRGLETALLASLEGASGYGGPIRVLRESVVRSEEHTSELQSLMSTSYAVFCLKKKKDN